MNTPLPWIDQDDPPQAFPDVELALEDPDGLLAAGGDLSPARLLSAYCRGIFPWYEEGQPILWWSPDPRCVIIPRQFHLPSRTRRALRRSGFEIRFNSAFAAVVNACAQPRAGQPGTWITTEMHAAYCLMHDRGWAHSVEIWGPDGLAGGLYGLAIDRVFFGESMFSRETNASKAAMFALCQLLLENNFSLLDCQMASRHLMTLGATLLPRRDFTTMLKNACAEERPFANWPSQAETIVDLLSRKPHGALQ